MHSMFLPSGDSRMKALKRPEFGRTSISPLSVHTIMYPVLLSQAWHVKCFEIFLDSYTGLIYECWAISECFISERQFGSAAYS